MFAANSLGFLAELGWQGVLAFLTVLIGYLFASSITAGYILGAKPGRGVRFIVGIVVSLAFLGVGRILWVMNEGGTNAQLRGRLSWGGGAGLGLGFWFILMSVKRAEPREPILYEQSSRPHDRSIVTPTWVPAFQSVIVGFIAVAFIGFGTLALSFAVSQWHQSNGIWIFGLFGVFAILGGLGLGRLAWVLNRRSV